MDIKAKLPYATVMALLVLISCAVSATAATKEVSSETGVYYTVKKGDTLWGLSQKFSDDPFTWPDLWSKNGQLVNPHRIYPGQKIKLIRKSDIDRYENHDSMSTMETDSGVPIETMAEKPEPYYYSRIEHAGFMTRQPVNPHGNVFKLHGNDPLMLGAGDTIYIKANPDTPLVIGAQYVSYRIIDPNETKEKLIGLSRKQVKRLMKQIGPQYLLTGIVEISGERGGYFIGKIATSYRSVKMNDMLMPYKKRSRYIPIRKGLSTVKGEIVISEEGETTFGQTMTGFINKGSRDGVQKGQIYSVFYNQTKESDELFGGASLSVPTNIGRFIVLDAREDVSTILAVYSTEGFEPGYEFRIAN